ncbi:peroxidase-like [Centruroides sculpturatus]|uniref:peroxidase-like n=1 Tax=Centruroides sculpturatus TaxID=218467 RepID=UPI000C6EE652|nr:peroxidase-like [Centruroides sculpturatus]
MIWGQFIDHDITLTPISRTVDNEMIQCCPANENDHPQCLPILISPRDYFYSKFNRKCLNFVRSARCSSCIFGPRQQTNQQTAFVDASQVYGTAVDDNNNLRSNNNDGKLLMRFHPRSGDVLPASTNPNSDSCSRPNENLLCFRAGDVRLNQNPALTSMHTIWAREHNRIAEQLACYNPKWSDEKLFQETRRIVIAEMQMITWNEFLPAVLGSNYMKRYSLNVAENGCTVYDPQFDPSLLNEFSTAAYRFGHSLIDGIFDLIYSENQKSSISLRDNYFHPFELYNGQLDGLMKGATQQPSQCFDELLVDDVRNHLYQRRGNNSGLDLVAFNILRGRDHGLPGYVSYVEHFFNVKIERFSDLRRFINPNTIEIFKKLYKSVHDVDLYTGGTSEIPVQGGIVGPVFASIIAEQFERLKFGDRFYFEHCNEIGSFTPEQLREIRKTTLARVLCDNTEIKDLQKKVFRIPDHWNSIVSCSRIPSVNLKIFS